MTGPMAGATTGGAGIVPRYEDGSSTGEALLWDCEGEWSGELPVRFPILAVTRQQFAMGDQRRAPFEDPATDSRQQVHGQDISGGEFEGAVAKGAVLRVEPPTAVELRHSSVTESSTPRPTRPTPPGGKLLSQAASVDLTNETSPSSQEGERLLSFPKQDITKEESYEEDPDRLNLKSILRMLEKPNNMEGYGYKHRWHMDTSCDVFHARQPFSAVQIGFKKTMTGRNQARVTVGPSGYFLGQRPRTMPMDSLQRTAFRPLEVLRPVSVSKSFDDRGRRPSAPPPTRDSNTQTQGRHFNFRNLELQSPLRVSPLHERSRSFQASPRKLKPVVKPSTARSWDGSYDRTVSPTYCTDILRATPLASPRDSAKALAIHSLSRKSRRNGQKEEADVWTSPSPVDRTNFSDEKQSEILRVPQHVIETDEKHVKFSMRKGKLTREDTFLSDMEPSYVDYTLRQQNKMSREMSKLLKKSHNPTRPPANTPVPVTPEY
ncbi:uncharacterized protein LOC144906943 [Branchiostoma floridae x Branchiostoma belcheri]